MLKREWVHTFDLGWKNRAAYAGWWLALVQ